MQLKTPVIATNYILRTFHRVELDLELIVNE